MITQCIPRNNQYYSLYYLKSNLWSNATSKSINLNKSIYKLMLIFYATRKRYIYFRETNFLIFKNSTNTAKSECSAKQLRTIGFLQKVEGIIAESPSGLFQGIYRVYESTNRIHFSSINCTESTREIFQITFLKSILLSIEGYNKQQCQA